MVSLVTLSPSLNSLLAQEGAYKWEIGAQSGISGFMGEYNSSFFSNPGFTFDLTGSYLYDVRWSFSLNMGFSHIRGSLNDDLTLAGKYENAGHFSNNVVNSSARVEFNFFPYGIGETYKQLYRWTPYVASGIGILVAFPENESCLASPYLPLAIGVKYKLNERLNLSAELSVAKTFSDKIDSIEDPHGISSRWFKNTDWISKFRIGISYELGKRCPTCHYVD